MAQGYFFLGKQNEVANFDYFFRENPYDSGYVVFAGLSDLLDVLQDFKFDQEDLNYLSEQGFKQEFLNYLSDFRFTGNIFSVQEGEVVFPNEPVLRVEGNLIETQVIETILLNILNFQSLIATKASRIRQAAGKRVFIDFGLRRSQGYGGIYASKAAVIGGANSTSNVFAGYHYGIPVTGTQAHSWIQSFDDEYTAFKKYAEIATGKIILLVDTYNTLKSGVPNAIKLAKELEKTDKRLFAIRLDSGDLSYFSKKARKMLDEAGLDYVKIVVSNQLDEWVIKSLIEQNAPIDSFGVGTNLVTGRNSAALDGIYKLSAINNQPKLKISDNVKKISLPGRKKVYRLIDEDGWFYGDAIALDEEKENNIKVIYHPFYPEKKTEITKFTKEMITQKVMENGKSLLQMRSLQAVNHYLQERLSKLSIEYKRFINPHIYKVGISKYLHELKQDITNQIRTNY
jgi:nicotinate phosphoribosyltransferase